MLTSTRLENVPGRAQPFPVGSKACLMTFTGHAFFHRLIDEDTPIMGTFDFARAYSSRRIAGSRCSFNM